MANAVYDPWKTQLMQGGANSSLGGTVKQTYVDITSAYTFSAADDFVTDLGTADNPNYGSAQSLANKTFGVVAASIFNADDVLTPALTGAADIGAVVLYVDSGAEATSRLAIYLDTGFVGLPFTPTGSDTVCMWAAGGIYKH
jgi:phage tail tape-measure protein